MEDFTTEIMDAYRHLDRSINPAGALYSIYAWQREEPDGSWSLISIAYCKPSDFRRMLDCEDVLASKRQDEYRRWRRWDSIEEAERYAHSERRPVYVFNGVSFHDF